MLEFEELQTSVRIDMCTVPLLTKKNVLFVEKVCLFSARVPQVSIICNLHHHAIINCCKIAYLLTVS